MRRRPPRRGAPSWQPARRPCGSPPTAGQSAASSSSTVVGCPEVRSPRTGRDPLYDRPRLSLRSAGTRHRPWPPPPHNEARNRKEPKGPPLPLSRNGPGRANRGCRRNNGSYRSRCKRGCWSLFACGAAPCPTSARGRLNAGLPPPPTLSWGASTGSGGVVAPIRTRAMRRPLTFSATRRWPSKTADFPFVGDVAQEMVKEPTHRVPVSLGQVDRRSVRSPRRSTGWRPPGPGRRPGARPGAGRRRTRRKSPRPAPRGRPPA